jgi:hypothetical protein
MSTLPIRRRWGDRRTAGTSRTIRELTSVVVFRYGVDILPIIFASTHHRFFMLERVTAMVTGAGGPASAKLGVSYDSAGSFCRLLAWSRVNGLNQAHHPSHQKNIN